VKIRLSMFLIAMVLLGLFNLAVPSRAFGDTIATFSVSGSLTNVDFSGLNATFDPGSTITIDTTTGMDVSAALNLNVGAAFSVPPSIACDTSCLNTATEYLWTVGAGGTGTPCPAVPPVLVECLLDLKDTNGTGFQGFAGGALTGGYFYFGVHVVGPLVNNVSNQITLTELSSITTPEPGSRTLTLIGAGLLGLMMAMRKRIAARLPQAD
jgi:hypothetical protein